jgi:hypothetical protein
MTRITLRSIVLALSAAILGACGSGTLAILGGSGGGGGSGNAPTVVSDVVVGSSSTDAKASPVAFSFRLTDAESNHADVDVFYVPPGGGPPVPVALAGGGSLDGLAASPSGVVHGFSWDFAAQVPTGNAYAEDYRLTVRTRNLASSADSAPFAIGNDAPAISNVVTPPGESSGIVVVPFTLADSSSDLVDVTVEYQDLDAGTGWKPATSAGSPLSNLATSPAGIPLFFWDADGRAGVEFRDAALHARRRHGVGKALDGRVCARQRRDPTAIVNGSAFYATPDQRRGIPLPIEILDPSRTRSASSSSTGRRSGLPDLPQDPAALLPILASPSLRLQYQIASESPISFGGRVVPGAPSSVRLPELASSQAGILAEGILGRDLEILRGSRVPVSAAAGWNSNPLSAPVGLLAYDDGHTAIVLDAPSAGSWRLREIDLATGAVVRNIATGTGDPERSTGKRRMRSSSSRATSPVRGPSRVALERVVTTLYTTSGANARLRRGSATVRARRS